MRRFYSLLILVISFLLLLSACNLPRAGGVTPTDSVLTVAAKTVSYQLTLLASNSGNTTNVPPIFVNLPTVTATPIPTSTKVPTATSVPYVPPPPPVYVPPCDAATFVTDVTIPDGTRFNPGQTFTKTWRLQNNGTCTWNTSYALIFDTGDAMGGPSAVPFPAYIAPGGYLDLSVNLTAPSTAGRYKGFWKLRNSYGATFGIGANANTSFWVEIRVESITPTPTVTATSSAPVIIYDFSNNYCDAQWVSGSGVLPCPGTTSDDTGFVVRVDNPTLENGTHYNGRALETHPQWVNDGVISGKFPLLFIQNGYHFKATVGCLTGGTACDVIFQLNYRSGATLQSLGQWNVKYADPPKDLDVDLSTLAGSSVQLVLAIMSNGPATQDWAVWLVPVVIK